MRDLHSVADRRNGYSSVDFLAPSASRPYSVGHLLSFEYWRRLIQINFLSMNGMIIIIGRSVRDRLRTKFMFLLVKQTFKIKFVQNH